MKVELTKEQLNKIKKELFWQQDKPCKELEPSFHEAVGFECGMMFMAEVLGLNWIEINKR